MATAHPNKKARKGKAGKFPRVTRVDEEDEGTDETSSQQLQHVAEVQSESEHSEHPDDAAVTAAVEAAEAVVSDEPMSMDIVPCAPKNDNMALVPLLKPDGPTIPQGAPCMSPEMTVQFIEHNKTPITAAEGETTSERLKILEEDFEAQNIRYRNLRVHVRVPTSDRLLKKGAKLEYYVTTTTTTEGEKEVPVNSIVGPAATVARFSKFVPPGTYMSGGDYQKTAANDAKIVWSLERRPVDSIPPPLREGVELWCKMGDELSQEVKQFCVDQKIYPSLDYIENMISDPGQSTWVNWSRTHKDERYEDVPCFFRMFPKIELVNKNGKKNDSPEEAAKFRESQIEKAESQWAEAKRLGWFYGFFTLDGKPNYDKAERLVKIFEEWGEPRKYLMKNKSASFLVGFTPAPVVTFRGVALSYDALVDLQDHISQYLVMPVYLVPYAPPSSQPQIQIPMQLSKLIVLGRYPRAGSTAPVEPTVDTQIKLAALGGSYF